MQHLSLSGCSGMVNADDFFPPHTSPINSKVMYLVSYFITVLRSLRSLKYKKSITEFLASSYHLSAPYKIWGLPPPPPPFVYISVNTSSLFPVAQDTDLGVSFPSTSHILHPVHKQRLVCFTFKAWNPPSFLKTMDVPWPGHWHSSPA